MSSKMWGEIIDQLPNFNSATVDVDENQKVTSSHIL